MNDYASRLHAAIRDKGNAVCVGLDPRLDQLPAQLLPDDADNASMSVDAAAEAYEKFCCRIVDVVAPLVPVVKPQAAFFEELGPSGTKALANVIRHARSAGLLVICDAKRGDIGSTAEAYARAYLAGADPNTAIWGADALTVNPYLGSDTLQPFVEIATERGAGVYVLVRTSNPGAGTFQDRVTDGETLFECVARTVEKLCAQTCGELDYGSIGAVVGATYPDELNHLRSLMPHVPLLVPGYGSQGGTAADVAGAFDADGLGAVVNSSRGIIFAARQKTYRERFRPDEWEKAVEEATRAMIADLAAHTPCGCLR
ncbi:MAG: orotidine-5'-phosphate decarboxylase [Planctomycetaceae bacterium]|nr:orotidine-5'-phosphate decarboxylase [Planctomycetaceae bacterium]